MSTFCTKLCVCVVRNPGITKLSALSQEQQLILDQWTPYLKNAPQGSSALRLQNNRLHIKEKQIGEFYIIACLIILDSGHQVCAQIFVSHLDHEMRQRASQQILEIVEAYSLG